MDIFGWLRGLKLSKTEAKAEMKGIVEGFAYILLIEVIVLALPSIAAFGFYIIQPDLGPEYLFRYIAGGWYGFLSLIGFIFLIAYLRGKRVVFRLEDKQDVAN